MCRDPFQLLLIVHIFWKILDILGCNAMQISIQFNEFFYFEYQMRRVLVCFIDLSCKIVEKRWYEEGSNGLPIYHIHPQIWVQALRSFLGLVVFERWIFNDEWQSRRNFWVRETPTILADKIQCVTPTSSLILLNVNRVNAPRPNK